MAATMTAAALIALPLIALSLIALSLIGIAIGIAIGSKRRLRHAADDGHTDNGRWYISTELEQATAGLQDRVFYARIDFFVLVCTDLFCHDLLPAGLLQLHDYRPHCDPMHESTLILTGGSLNTF